MAQTQDTTVTGHVLFTSTDSTNTIGYLWYDFTSHKIQYYNGSTVISL